MENIRHLRSYQYVVSFVIGLIYFSLKKVCYYLFRSFTAIDKSFRVRNLNELFGEAQTKEVHV